MFFPIISGVWILSEILLARVKISRSDRSQDKSTLRILWAVILLSIVAGVFVWRTGIGQLGASAARVHDVGVGFIALGLLVRWWAILTLKRFFTVDVSVAEDHEVVTSGLYRYIRHPAYLGSLLSFLGLGMAFANVVTVIVIFVPIFVAFSVRIAVEEAALRQALGEAYSAYCRRTKRLLPGIY